MSRLGIKTGNGVIAGLQRYFDNNPTEELSLEDIAAKFGCEIKTAKNAVSELNHKLEVVQVVRRRGVEA